VRVSTIRPTGNWDGTGFAHEAFAFATDEELIGRVLPFLIEGFARREPVLVVAGERVRTLLAEQLGVELARLAAFAAAETWWRGGHGTLQAYDRDLRVLRGAAPSWRLAAEPVWLAREDGRQWSRFESVANSCYADLPYYSLCLHDRKRLPATVLDAVARSHPLTWDGAAPVPQERYEEPRAFLRSAQPAWTARPAGVAVVPVTRPRSARRMVSVVASEGWSSRIDDVVLATHELVRNALKVAPFADVAAWADGDRLVVEVTDAGPGLPDETRGYVPPGEGPDAGRGMWLAWSIADDAAVRSGPAGTAIRLFFARGAAS
jgi:anti-sigma regulatory factor (Ser/Thr protein kinase)